MKNYVQRLLTLAAYLSRPLMITLAPAQALTLKTGEVLGSDGNI